MTDPLAALFDCGCSLTFTDGTVAATRCRPDCPTLELALNMTTAQVRDVLESDRARES